jgi:hypothetical protein
MMTPNAPRLFFISLVLLVMISYPVASAFNSPKIWLGVPLLPAYLFMVWAVFIVTIWLLVRRMPNPNKKDHYE